MSAPSRSSGPSRFWMSIAALIAVLFVSLATALWVMHEETIRSIFSANPAEESADFMGSKQYEAMIEGGVPPKVPVPIPENIQSVPPAEPASESTPTTTVPPEHNPDYQEIPVGSAADEADQAITMWLDSLYAASPEERMMEYMSLWCDHYYKDAPPGVFGVFERRYREVHYEGMEAPMEFHPAVDYWCN